MKRTIKFLDAERCLVSIEIDTNQSYFSMTGEREGHCGQIRDYIKPKNEYQQQLVDIWKQHHLSKINPIAWLEKQINSLCDKIEEIEEEEKDRKVTEEDIDLFDDFDEPEKAIALALLFELSVNEIEDISNERDNYWSVQGIEYLFGTDEEMDDEWDEHLDNYIDECVLPEIPKYLQFYFDEERFKDDCKTDGRAYSLNIYDGEEEEVIEFDGTKYFAYRQ